MIRRLERRTGARLSEARIYHELRKLAREGLVKAMSLAPRGRRGGRTRVYYHLTPAGAAAAEAERETLLALLAPVTTDEPTARERERMALRILEAEELAEAGEELRVAKPR